MKHIYGMAAVASLALGATAAHADVDLSVAIHGEIAPGVYGRVDIGNRPPPALVYAQPVMIEPPPAQVTVAEPIYLHVPPEHAHNWQMYCHEYHACNRRVYFVKSVEYDPAYIRAREHEREEARREQHEEHEMRQEERHERHEEERRERHEDHDHDRDHDHDDQR